MSLGAVIAIIITIIFILLGFIFHRSKIIFGIQMVWMWLIMGFNTYSVDWNSTYPIFIAAKDRPTLHQDLYQNLCTIFKLMGFNFIGFNMIMSLIALVLIAKRIYNDAHRPALVASLIFLYPFVEFVIQKRFFLAFALAFWVLPKAFSNEKKDKIFFIVVIFLAGWIHSSIWFYFVFIVISKFSESFLYKMVGIIVIISAFSPRVLYYLIQLLPLVSKAKFELYFITYAQNSSLIKYIFWIAFHMCFFGEILFIYIQLRKKNIKETSRDSTAMLENIGALFLLPFYSFDPVFTRVFRPVILSNYIYITNFVTNGTKQKKFILIVNVLQVLLALGTFILMYVFMSEFSVMVLTIFENNAFIDIIFGG